MSDSFAVGRFVVCCAGHGFVIRDGKREAFSSHFSPNSVGVIEQLDGDCLVVYLIGQDKSYIVPRIDSEVVDVFKTGKGYGQMICNLCHALKDEEAFDINQTDAGGNITRRPSCQNCRQDHIDKKPMTAKERREAEKHRPPPGAVFHCPICKKRGIVGVNVRVVLDHRHSTGTARAFLCDSCNTGLGRFKNGENYLRNALDYLASFENSNT